MYHIWELCIERRFLELFKSTTITPPIPPVVVVVAISSVRCSGIEVLVDPDRKLVRKVRYVGQVC